MTINKYSDELPGGTTVTAYDKANVKLYLRLLDAHAQGACWKEVVEALFGISPEAEPERAAHVHRAHFDRAQWMSQRGYSGLLAGHVH